MNDINEHTIRWFYTNSLMFLEVTKAAAKDIENEYFNVGDYQNAIAYNLFTAYELFLKYAIYSAISDTEYESFKPTHNLGELYKKYREHYTEEKYKLRIPLYPTEDSTIEGATAQQLEEMKKYNFDQMLKYPLDNKKKHWPMGITTKFEFSFCEDTKKGFERIFQLIESIQ